MKNLDGKILNFLDIETTGMNFNRDRVIEIYIAKVLDNKIIDEFHKFINPGFRPDRFILNLTNISYEELKNADNFADIADELNNFLSQGLIIAHNARFDYGFLKHELRRSDIFLKSNYACSVKLSRLLYPEHRRHGLDSIVERFGLEVENRHRADSDTKAVIDFFYKAFEEHGESKFIESLNKVINKGSLPSELSDTDFKKFPNKTGVYIFSDKEKQPLYIGKSINLRSRILDHIYSDTQKIKDFKVNSQTTDIEIIETAGEIGALLRESYLIKKLLPLHNQKLRRNKSMVKLIIKKNDQGYNSLVVKRDESIDTEEIENIIGIFGNIKFTKFILAEYVNKYGLCPKFLDLEKGSGACFSFQIRKCKGACIGEIDPIEYNRIFDEAFEENKVGTWPFKSAIIVEEDNEEIKEKLLFYKWCFLGSDLGKGDSKLFSKNSFDFDAYKIIKNYINKGGKVREIEIGDVDFDLFREF